MAAILLGRVDLRVDRQPFRNNIKIQDSLWVVSYVSLSRIGTGRHGGRPSQEPEANSPSIYASPASVPDEAELVPPKSQKPIHRRSMPLPLIDDEPQKSPVR